MQSLSEKSLSFCQKILTHYPLAGPTNSPTSEQQFQPFSHMHDHRKERQIYDKTTSEKLDNMSYFKNLGNQKFKVNEVDEALYFYQKVIVYGDYTFPEDKLDVFKMELLLEQANMNSALCYIKKGKWKESEVHLRQTLKQGKKEFEDFQNIESYSAPIQKSIREMMNSKINTLKKGIYWSCKFQIKKLDFEKANEYVEQLLKLNQKISSKEEAQQLLQEIDQIKKQYHNQSQKLSKKMFSANKNIL